jgi:hypothetical protein
MKISALNGLNFSVGIIKKNLRQFTKWAILKFLLLTI